MAFSLKHIAFGLSIFGFVGIGDPAFAGGDAGRDPGDPPPQSKVVYSGSDWVTDASYFYQGIVVALNRDLDKNGVMFRAYGSYALYEYNADVPGGRVDGDAFIGDVMVGYRVGLGRIEAVGYIGVDFQDHDLTPNDPENSVRGSEAGFKVAGDISTTEDKEPLYFTLNGQYSTAFDSYWTRARIGLNKDRFTFGPEGIAFGNEGFDAQRLGGFLIVRYNLAPNIPAEFSIAIGHQFVGGDSGGGGDTGAGGAGGGEGTYVSIGHSFVF